MWKDTFFIFIWITNYMISVGKYCMVLRNCGIFTLYKTILYYVHWVIYIYVHTYTQMYAYVSICRSNHVNTYACMYTHMYSKSSLTDNLHRSTTLQCRSLYLSPRQSPIQYHSNNNSKPTISLNGRLI